MELQLDDKILTFRKRLGWVFIKKSAWLAMQLPSLFVDKPWLTSSFLRGGHNCNFCLECCCGSKQEIMTVLLLHVWWMNVGGRALTGWEFGAAYEDYSFFFWKISWLGVYFALERKDFDLGLITSLASEFTEVNVPLSDSTSLSIKTHL